MTTQEATLIFFDDYFKRHKLDYMIHASSLLHIVREGKLPISDNEIDLVCHGEDLNETNMTEFKKDCWRMMYPHKDVYGEMYFSVNTSIGDGVYVALTPLWNKKGHVYLSVNENVVVEWTNKELYDKSNWKTIKYLDREFKVPGDPEKYLEMWYGADWRTPLACSWNDNKNVKKWEALQ
jgi:hypothetical protein